MAFFKKKNQKAEEVEQQKKDPAADLKAVILNALNDKLNGTLYDDCVIMPKGYTVDVQVSRHEVKDEIHIMQVVFIIKNDEFDEPLIEPVDALNRKSADNSVNHEIALGHISGVCDVSDEPDTYRTDL